jgi:Tfp pilus assembly protein PilF
LNTFREYATIALPSTVVVIGGKISYELPGFPLTATEDMFDYLSVLAGDTPRKKIEKAYEPVHAAIADTNLAREFVRKKLYTMAHPMFRKAIEKDPKYMRPYVELAKLQETEGNAASAAETLNKALSVSPDNVVVMSELGFMLVKTGKVKESLDILAKAVAKNSYTPSHYYYAYALGRDGKMKEAFASFDAALSLNPFEPSIYLLRAETYENSAMLKEASADYKKALALMLNIK